MGARGGQQPLGLAEDLLARAQLSRARGFEKLDVGEGVPGPERDPGRRVELVGLRGPDLAVEEARGFERQEDALLDGRLQVLRLG